jgi:hypothetical protein|tara:strand:- start:4233 stop:5228 length:996 start_codon:yes stop_codon:yes gene_type:complete
VKLPSKKLVVVGIPLILALGVVLFVLFEQSETKTHGTLSVSEKSALSQALADNAQDLDKDGDGLKDWEELLWGTDPRSSDTDGDGIGDGREVDESRNPTIPGPNDALPEDIVEQAREGVFIQDSGTATDVFAQNFFAEYLSLKRGGSELDTISREFLIDSAIRNVPASISEKTYTLSDIIVGKNGNTENVRRYGNELGEVINLYGKPNVEHELVILKKSLEKEDREKLRELDQITDSYRTVVSKFLTVSVPKGGEEAHLNLVNSSARAGITIETFGHVYEDPIGTLNSVVEYQERAKELLTALRDMRQYFVANGVFFEESEAGSIFFIDAI